ncbi:SusC/RagA family TonB-linked outer membrane protein [Niabella yanshanensis]|uniref:SusC/RagA family TonB-linked outer membrane protein n=1 Tax=Niabella yanshanensis TaxID=577386 RepID=A0ABZ0WBB4_9BACT|nr:SusC/RagA family TonB-linked outer membrane protein [Niabella yanshanensis]WQD39265.1 SusC/RagA family TonB-linked outer membrane protein [Niabella yanshanensis]
MKFTCLLVLLALFNGTVHAQTRSITGSVLDDASDEPVAGVTIRVKGGPQSAVTDAKGSFTLNVPTTGGELEYSHVGYEVGSVAIPAEGPLIIRTKKLNVSMDDVVVIGYGTQKRSQLTGAVANIKGEEIQDVPAPNIAGALRGRIAGLSVSQASGRPGAGITLNIRNSATSAEAERLGVTDEPLYIIDGITVTKDAFDNIDPSMVEDITVLKDAGSAAIYGASGANGVVLLTTKRGRAGKPRFSYNGYIGISDATRLPDMMSSYELAKALNDNNRVGYAQASDYYSDSVLNYLKTLPDGTWLDALWKPSQMNRHNLSISGGSENVTYFVGGNYQNENGNYAGIKQDKFGFRAGVVATIVKGLKADVNFNVDHRIRYSGNPTANEDQQFIERLAQVPEWVPYQIDGQYLNFGGDNPFGSIGSGYYRESKSASYRINTALTYDFSGVLKGLTARFQISQSSGSDGTTTYQPPYTLYNYTGIGPRNAIPTQITEPIIVNQGNNSLYEPGLSRSNSYQGFFTLQYKKTIANNHNLTVLGGAEQSESNSESVGVRWLTQILPGLDDFWAFDQSTTSPSRGITVGVKRSFFGRLNYDYMGKYSLEGVIRADASSNFALGKVWGVFPSIGAGWVVSRENFFKDNITFINFLKLRASYGIVGNSSIDAWLWKERFRADVSGYLYGNSLQGGLNPERIPNPDISWESKRTFNAGLEMAMWRDKITLGIDVFQNRGYDMFDKGADASFPAFAGFAAPVVNYMERYNWGTEFTIGYKANLAKDLRLNVSTNFGFGNSVTTRMLYDPFKLFETTPEDWQVGFGTDPRRYTSGNWGYRVKGIFRTQEQLDAFMAENPNYLIDNQAPQLGWMYFDDANGDGVITERDKVLMFDRIDPKLVLNTQLGLTYKSIQLRVNIIGRFGGKEFVDSKAREMAGNASNLPAFMTDRWSPENPNGRFPRFDSRLFNQDADIWAVDGTMIRVNDMTLSYTLPKAFLSRIRMSDASLLLTGNNLWVLKNPLKYKDPYQNYIFDYPTIRTISVGLRLGL